MRGNNTAVPTLQGAEIFPCSYCWDRRYGDKLLLLEIHLESERRDLPRHRSLVALHQEEGVGEVAGVRRLTDF